MFNDILDPKKEGLVVVQGGQIRTIWRNYHKITTSRHNESEAVHTACMHFEETIPL